ncbi:MAG: molybdopterin cofactor-binding domain-containing protein [Pseudomonadota bacterium]
MISGNPDAALPLARVASAAHWAPATLPELDGDPLRETARWTAPELTAPSEADEINSSLSHAFIFDFCGVEIDPVTSEAKIDRYVTMHDCGTVLHDGMVEGQIRGGFAHGLGAALLEEYVYDDEGAFLTGTFADYPAPSVHEIPPLEILHTHTPSPVTPLGAKGVGEGNCMSTPVCIANAVADALAPAGDVDLTLPVTPARIAELAGAETAPPAEAHSPADIGAGVSGEGAYTVPAEPQSIWDALMDPEALASLIPGAHAVRPLSETDFEIEATLGVGPVKGRYLIEIALSELDPPHSAILTGRASGALGNGEGSGRVTLTATTNGTEIAYNYQASVGGKVAAVGGRMLNGAAKIIIGRFFAALGRHATGDRPGLVSRLWRRR